MTIPTELLSIKHWITWQRIEVNGRMTKVPISPWDGRKASCDKPRTWSSYRHACVAMSKFDCDGVGFVFTEADPFCGIDLDECREENGDWTEQARRILEKLSSFSELSPSGNGAHIIVKAKLPAGRHPKGIGMFDRLRYFTITGNHIAGMPATVEDRQSEVNELYAELFPVVPVADNTRMTLNLSDSELVDKARNARNGDKFYRLWNGELTDFGGDWSAADLALCSHLAFWTGGDAGRVDSLFRQSGLMRSKWDRRTGQSSYGAMTIAKALARSVAA